MLENQQAATLLVTELSVSRYVMQFEFHSMLIRNAEKGVHHEEQRRSSGHADDGRAITPVEASWNEI